jgi:uncharacterized membrane protein YebE (DUF533 family)
MSDSSTTQKVATYAALAGLGYMLYSHYHMKSEEKAITVYHDGKVPVLNATRISTTPLSYQPLAPPRRGARIALW